MILVGIISGQELFSAAVLDELNSRPEIRAEWVTLGPQSLADDCPYNVIIDRLSHCYEFYQAYLKKAALSGTYVINNPFRFLCDDKFFNYSLANSLKVPTPKTVLLPAREYDERILNKDDLHNLKEEFNWDSVLEEVGLPAIVKPYDGYGWREVYRVNTVDELAKVYEESMMDVMMAQEFIEFDHYVRCFVVGTEAVLPTRYDPVARKYIIDHKHLSPDLGEKITFSCRALCKRLGYDMNTVEFAIRDGIPYAIDFMNPVPEAKPEVITPLYFSWLVKELCDFTELVAREKRKTPYIFS